MPVMRFVLVLCCLFLPGIKASAQEIDSRGVWFYANTSAEERTALLINNGKPIDLDGSFSLSFDIAFWTLDITGNILTIYDGSDEFINLIFDYFSDSNNYILHLLLNNAESRLKILIPKSELARYAWNNIELRVNENHSEVSAYRNDVFIGTITASRSASNSLKFVFGPKSRSTNLDYFVTGMILREIGIFQEDEILYRWALNPVRENIAYDSKNDLPLLLEKPKWLIDAHYRWTFLGEYDSPEIYSGAIDTVRQRLLLDLKNSMIIYDFYTGKDTLVQYRNSRPSDCVALEYDSKKDLIYSTNCGRSIVSTYNFSTRSWTQYDTANEKDLHFYGLAFWQDFDSGLLLALGGYGWYTVKDSLFRYDFPTDTWVPIDYKNDGFTPRYLMAIGAGLSPGEYFIFAGNGNKTGKHFDLFTESTELFRFSLKDSSITFLMSFPRTYRKARQGIRLFLIPEERAFYTLSQDIDSVYIGMNLLRWNLDTRTVTKTAETFNVMNGEFGDYFFYAKSTHSFYFIRYDPERKKVKLYTLLYPPLEKDPLAAIPEHISSVPLLLFIGTGVLTFIFFMVWIFRKKKTPLPIESDSIQSDISDNALTIETSPPVGNISISQKNRFELFGGFTMIDDQGGNISVQFSAKIKEIFLLIAIRSFESGKSSGISSEELSSIIWPDFSYESVKSNRNVSINKIRKIITQVEGLELEFSSKLWKLVQKKDFTCDLIDFQNIINGNGNEHRLKNEKLQALLSIVEHGEFLSGISYAWLDLLKATINSEIIETLKNQFGSELLLQNNELLLRICNAVQKIDNVDEESFLKKMEILITDRKSGAAKSCYDLFAAEYKRLYDVTYPRSFKDIAAVLKQ